jgi:hypothetical protein
VISPTSGSRPFASPAPPANGEPEGYDSKDWRLNAGLRWRGEIWAVDGGFSYSVAVSRHVSADDAFVFPGKCDSKPAYLLSVMVTKKF